MMTHHWSLEQGVWKRTSDTVKGNKRCMNMCWISVGAQEQPPWNHARWVSMNHARKTLVRTTPANTTLVDTRVSCSLNAKDTQRVLDGKAKQQHLQQREQTRARTCNVKEWLKQAGP